MVSKLSAIVTKSFEEGYCVIAGNPAKIIKKLNPETCERYEDKIDFIGYIPINQFETFRLNNLNV